MNIGQALDKIPKTVSTKAVKGLKNYPIIYKERVPTLETDCNTVGDALLNFIWGETKEGIDYWFKKYLEYEKTV